MRYLLFVLVCGLSVHCMAQEYIQYCEQRKDQDVNCYTFIPAPKPGTSGIVEKLLRTEDGEWYGRAPYKATDKKITAPSFHLYPATYTMDGDRLVRTADLSDPSKALYVKRLVFYRTGHRLMLEGKAADGSKKELYFQPQSPETAEP